MGQADLELELNAWKKVALNKQNLMDTAAKALGLPTDCTSVQLEKALTEAIRKGTEAEADIKKAKDEASSAIADMEKKVVEAEKVSIAAQEAKDAAEKSLIEAQEAKAKAEEAEKHADQRIAAAREANALEVKKVTNQLNEKKKEIQAINKALADTPENVIKKLKSLKKDKHDESSARKQAEAEARTLRKDKKTLEQELEQNKSALEQAAKLAEAYRELHQLAQDLKAGKDNVELPELDESLLENLEVAEDQQQAA